MPPTPRRTPWVMRMSERTNVPVHEQLSLTEIVSHVLDRGAVISGDVMISVAASIWSTWGCR